MLRRGSLALLALFLACGCYSSPAATNPTGTPIAAGANTVLLPSGMYASGGSTTFTPSSLTVAVGTTVTWGNNDAYAHTSTADGGQWNVSMNPGQTGSFQFTTAGTYTYHCSLHPAEKGTIIVN